MTIRPSIAALAVAFFAVPLVACGGSGGGSSPTPVTSATPTSAPASPAPSPSATASGVAPQTSTASIVFSSNAAVTFTVAEAGYAGAFTETDTCRPATGAIASVAAVAGASPAAYAVTPLGAGTCSIAIADASGRTTSVTVVVSTASIGVQ